jgi:branched-subunit amino acid transport protein AzlD
VIDFLRWLFNILLELRGDGINILILFSRANYIHLKIYRSFSVSIIAIIFIIDWFELKIDLVTHIIPFKVSTVHVIVHEFFNNVFSYSILLALLIDYKTFFNGNAFLHLDLNDFIACCV